MMIDIIYKQAHFHHIYDAISVMPASTLRRLLQAVKCHAKLSFQHCYRKPLEANENCMNKG